MPDKPELKGSWTSEENPHLDPHFFRRSFSVTTLPFAVWALSGGPGAATAYVNGEHVAHFQVNIEVNIGIHVIAVDVAHVSKRGRNVIAIEAIREPRVGSSGNSRRGCTTHRRQDPGGEDCACGAGNRRSALGTGPAADRCSSPMPSPPSKTRQPCQVTGLAGDSTGQQ